MPIPVPRGYDYILFLSFDFDADSAEHYTRADPVALSRGVFGARHGVPRILRILEDHGVKVTFFTPGWVAETYPEAVSMIAQRGHEVASHGYLHEKFDLLSSRVAEEAVLRRSEEAILHVAGSRPLGFRAPYWRFSPHTMELLTRHGYLYDSSLMDAEEPYLIRLEEDFMAELPVDWRLDDWPYLEYHRSLTPSQLLDMWIEEMMYARERRRYLSLTMHPQCIARGARIRVLEGVLSHAARTNAYITRGDSLARMVAEAQQGS